MAIDILLISETHFTNKSYCCILVSCIHSVYIVSCNAPGKTHEGTALIIRSDIRHYEIGKYQREFLQDTSIMVEDHGLVVLLFQPYTHHLNML